jgi:FG-GAP-like repeat/RTX calcium-binding nonapeptide repeat (4 copies)
MKSNLHLEGYAAPAFRQKKEEPGRCVKTRFRYSAVEPLECRIAPAYTSFPTGTIVSFLGDAASDTLEFSEENGLLKHNRFTAGDAGFASDFDFESFTPGDQTMAADSSTVITIQLGTGSDTVILGADGQAGLLKATFSITNTGADADVLRVDQSAATGAVALTASGNIIASTGVSVFRAGDIFATLDLRTGAGADTVTLSGILATNTNVTAGAGDDTVSANGTTTRVFLDGGEGNDRLTGGNESDILLGGAGNDLLVGRNGDDFILAGEGFDTFSWAPGDDNDTLEGQDGQDLLVFNGANISEVFDVSANGGRVRLIRDVATVVMDLNDVEEVQLNTFAGLDTVNVNDLSGTDVRAVRVSLAASTGNPDGLTDTVVLNGTANDDDVHIVTDGTKISAVGLAPLVELTGFDGIDHLNVLTAGGTDNVFASDAAKAKLVITHTGETSNGALVGDLTFTQPAHQPVGKTPSAIVAGNLIGPGNDLVITNAKANSISVLLNTGNGAFLPAINLKTGGKKPTGIALGDFNGDNRLDIAVTNKGSGNISVFFNDGDGTFSVPVLFTAGKAPGKLRAADVTGDGKIDLVMLSGSNKVTILANDGTGGFSPSSKLPTGGRGSVDLVLGDFSGDGRTDIAIANAGSKNVTLLPADPTFLFGPPLPFKVSGSPRSLAVGDIDDDGALDLAVSHRISKFVSVLLNVSSGGVAAFDPELKVETGGRAPSAIALEDIDLDGHDDLVLTDSTASAISVLLNTGPANFLQAVTFDLDQNGLRKNVALVATDLNEDGRPDFAVANAVVKDVSVLDRQV